MPIVLALALAAGPTEAERYVMGRYTAVDNASGRAVCPVRLRWQAVKGGRGMGVVEAGPACAKATPLDRASRWFAGDDGYWVEDALRRRVAKISDDDAGIYLTLPGGRVLRLEPAGVAPARAPSGAGSWAARDTDAKLLCRFTLQPGGAIGPTAACPPTLRPFGGGRWTASATGLTLRGPKGQVKQLSWEDDDHLNGDDLTLAVVRETRR
jgi:hypothetical protein